MFPKWLAMAVIHAAFIAPWAMAQDGHTVTGTVTDENGAPVACGVVVVSGPGGFRAAVTTDANGVYVLEDLAPGEYNLELHSPDLAFPELDSKAPPRTNVNVMVAADQPIDEPIEQDFANQALRGDQVVRSILGFVFLGDTDTPIPLCEMFARTPDCEQMDITFTCESGLYELVLPDDLEMEEVTVSFVLPDFEPVPFTFDTTGETTIMAPDIILQVFGEDVGSILGSVWDSQGDPVVRAQIFIEADTKGDEPMLTNCHGAFKAEGLAPGQYQVTVLAPGFEETERTVLVQAGQTPTEVSITLQQSSDRFGCRLSSGPGNAAGGGMGDLALFVVAASAVAFWGRRGHGLVRSRKE